MILLASLRTAVAAYLAAGLLVGYAPRAGFRRASKPDLSQRQLWLIQAGSDLTTWQFMAGSGAIGLVVLALATLMTGAWWLALMPAAGAALLPQVYYTRRRADRIRQLRRAWPDALRDALAAITAGSTLVLALYDLAERGPAPLRPAFGRFRLVSRMMGVVPALELVKEELADPTSDRVIEVLVLAYQHGSGGRRVPGPFQALGGGPAAPGLDPGGALHDQPAGGDVHQGGRGRPRSDPLRGDTSPGSGGGRAGRGAATARTRVVLR